LLLTTGGSDDEKVLYAQQALKHFNKILEQEPGNAEAIQYKVLALNTLKKANALKALHDKEEEERREERTDEELVSWLLERAAIECGQRTPEDSLREVKLALASGQFPGMGIDLGPDGTRSVRVNTLKPEERAEIKKKANLADPKPTGSKRLIQYGKQKPRESILSKQWREIDDDVKSDLASNTKKAMQAAMSKISKGEGVSFAYEEDNGQMGEQLPPSSIEEEGIVTSGRRK
jgi:hypothetical protein